MGKIRREKDHPVLLRGGASKTQKTEFRRLEEEGEVIDGNDTLNAFLVMDCIPEKRLRKRANERKQTDWERAKDRIALRRKREVKNKSARTEPSTEGDSSHRSHYKGHDQGDIYTLEENGGKRETKMEKKDLSHEDEKRARVQSDPLFLVWGKRCNSEKK